MIRQANTNDSTKIAKLIISGWQTAYRGLIDSDFLNSMSIDLMNKNWYQNILNQNSNDHIYVYEESDKILGVIRFGKAENNSNHDAEIYVLYVEPSLKRNRNRKQIVQFCKRIFYRK